MVITIIVLLILASISIATLTGKGGIFSKASEATQKTKMEEEKERLELVKAEVAIENDGQVTIDKYIEKLKEKDIVDQEEITENEDGSIEFVTDKDYSVNNNFK